MPAHKHPVQITSPPLDAHLARLTLANYRPRTVKSRRGCVVAFARSILPRDLLEATRSDVEAFLARPLAAASRRSYRSHLRAF